ncbi:endothelin-3-like [Mustelus asterias]
MFRKRNWRRSKDRESETEIRIGTRTISPPMWILLLLLLLGALPRAGVRGGGPFRHAQVTEAVPHAPAHPGINALEVADLVVPARPRVKRCSCYSFKDKECVYYCHLDVIWMNSPQRIVPYGLTNVQRHKRSNNKEAIDSLGAPRVRCVCTEESDEDCGRFCRHNRSLPDKTKNLS